MSVHILFEPYQLNDITLKNRIVMAPMTRGRAGDTRVPNDLMAEHYFQRTGAGMIITEATVISEQGIGWIGSPGIYNEEMVAGWRKVTERVKPTGTALFLQLWHCGRASHSDFHQGQPPLSASNVKIGQGQIRTPQGKKDYEAPRPMTIAEIDATVTDYRRAAEYAKEAGFAGVEVHGANGYLLNQFLDSRCNRRTDEYGGSPANRYRFLSRVLAAILEVWPAHRVGVRLSPNGVFNDMGSDDFRETYLFVVRELNKLNLGYVHIMDGLAFGFHGRGEAMTLAEFRPLYAGTIIGNCGYTREDAAHRLTTGLADLAAVGRPFITNPDLVERWKHDWPLAPYDDMALWYTPGPEGYVDYPPFRGRR